MRHNPQRYFRSILRAGCKDGTTHFFLSSGSGEELNALWAKLQRRFPTLQIAGMYAASGKPFSEQEEHTICQMVSDAKADVLWVGLDQAKEWMLAHQAEMPHCVMIGIEGGLGFLLDAVSGFWLR